MSVFDVLQERGFIKQMSHEAEIKELLEKEKITFLKKNRHKIRIYSFILLYLQCQKVKEAIYNRF